MKNYNEFLNEAITAYNMNPKRSVDELLWGTVNLAELQKCLFTALIVSSFSQNKTDVFNWASGFTYDKTIVEKQLAIIAVSSGDLAKMQNVVNKFGVNFKNITPSSFASLVSYKNKSAIDFVCNNGFSAGNKVVRMAICGASKSEKPDFIKYLFSKIKKLTPEDYIEDILTEQYGYYGYGKTNLDKIKDFEKNFTIDFTKVSAAGSYNALFCIQYGAKLPKDGIPEITSYLIDKGMPINTILSTGNINHYGIDKNIIESILDKYYDKVEEQILKDKPTEIKRFEPFMKSKSVKNKYDYYLKIADFGFLDDD